MLFCQSFARNIAKELGAVDFMEKSTDLSDVVKKIRETLRKE